MAYELVVVGCSWGGLEATSRILEHLPADLDVAVAVAQHRGPARSALAELLGAKARWPVCEAEDKESIAPRRVYLAPPGYHLLVEPGHCALSTEAPVHHSRPSVDVLFETAADAYGDRLIGVVLTGANADGAAGVRRIAEHGGHVVVQDPSTAERDAMPRAALATGVAAAVVPLNGIAHHLGAVCRRATEARA